MEARATFRGARVSGTFVAAVLIIVALGVGAFGGYAAARLGGGKAASPSQAAPVAGTIVNQSRATLPAWLIQEMSPKTSARLRQDDPAFIAQYATNATLPGWLVQEISPNTSPRLPQDDPEFIARYAKSA